MSIKSFKKDIGFYLALVMFTGITGFGGYAKIWEHKQPKEEIKNAIIKEIHPYYHRNELHWPFRGNGIYVEGESKLIDFPSNKWDNTIKVGDSVDMIVRKNFPLFGEELDGLQINDYK